jgi:hypothetical protein
MVVKRIIERLEKLSISKRKNKSVLEIAEQK